MKKITTVTRKYDDEGRVIEETTVEEDVLTTYTPTWVVPYTPNAPWYQTFICGTGSGMQVLVNKPVDQ